MKRLVMVVAMMAALTVLANADAVSLTQNSNYGASGQAFAANGGPTVTLANATNFSIALNFSLDSTAGWVKLMDFKNLGTDFGLYSYNGQVTFYATTGIPAQTPITAGQNVQMVVTRDAATGIFTISLNNGLVISFTDSSQYGVGIGGVVNLFHDDSASGGNESKSGIIYSLSTFNGVLNSGDVTYLLNGGDASTLPSNQSSFSAIATPEPASLMLLGSGLGAALLRRRRASASN